MTWRDSDALVEAFWRELRSRRRDPDARDHLIHRGFVLASSGGRISGRRRFNAWVKRLSEEVEDLQFHPLETFSNHDGTRVGARWRMTGGRAEPHDAPFTLTGRALWAVEPRGLILHNWSIDALERPDQTPGAPGPGSATSARVEDHAPWRTARRSASARSGARPPFRRAR